MAMKNKKTTVVGYLTIFIAVGTLVRGFLTGEPVDVNSISAPSVR